MTQSADTDDTDILGRSTGAVLLKRGEDGSTTAQHGSGIGGVEVGGDVNGKVRWAPPLVGVATLRLVPLALLSSLEDAGVGTTDAAVAVLLPV